MIAALLAGTMALSACTSVDDARMADVGTGAAIGAAGGAGVGALVGGVGIVEGAVIGAAIGAVLSYNGHRLLSFAPKAIYSPTPSGS